MCPCCVLCAVSCVLLKPYETSTHVCFFITHGGEIHHIIEQIVVCLMKDNSQQVMGVQSPLPINAVRYVYEHETV